MTPRIVVKKKDGDPFAEISFSHSEGRETDSKPIIEEKKSEPVPEHHAEHRPEHRAEHNESAPEKENPRVSAEKADVKKGEEMVGVNLLTQKPIIKGVKRKPVIRSVSEGSAHPQKQSADSRGLDWVAADEEEEMARDLTVAELRRRQLQDITPVSNAPSERKREASRREAVELAHKIWNEREERKPLHHKLLRRLGFH